MSSRRFVALFLVVLALPAVMLLWFNVQSLRSMWFPTDATPTADPAQLAATLERRVSDLVMEVLQDRELSAGARSGLESISQRRQFREAVAHVRQRHPILRSVFIVRNGTVQFPRTASAARGSAGSRIDRGGGAESVRVLLGIAERQQREKRYTEALATLKRAGSGADSPAQKALVLQRSAACLRSMGLRNEADSTYAMLAARYGEEYSPDGLPYAVVASLARERIDESELARIYRLLISGQWEVPIEQAAQLRAAFEKRLGANAQHNTTDDLHELDMARALQKALHQRSGSAGQRKNTPVKVEGKPGLFALAFAGRTNYQSYYTVLSRADGAEVLLGLTVDLDWIQKTLCPDLGIGDTFELGYTRDAVAPAVSTPFQTAFPFWNLRPATVAARQSAAHLETMIAMSSEVLAAILCFGLYVLHRHVAREREAIRMRGDFVSGVSHELRTPITVIRLYSETLMECPELPSEGREFCEVISCEAQRLDRLVEGVLNVSAIERGIKKYSLSEHDLGQLASQTLGNIRRYYHYKGYTVSEDIARDLPRARVDVEAFKSALLNLVDNAIKYSNSSHVVRVCVYRSGSSVVVAVEDSGIGIAPDALERIFEPFYRADNAGAHGGCGLGLYLVRHIMTAHGGSVRVTSELGAGSRFELVFPLSVKSGTERAGAQLQRVAAVSAREDQPA